METKIISKDSWSQRLAFPHLIEVITEGFSRCLLVLLSLGLLVLPSAATALNKAQYGRTNRRIASPVRAIAAPHVAPIVTNTSDSGPGSLRQALIDAQDGDTVTFNISSATLSKVSSSVTVIALTSGELVINNNITLSGPGAATLAIQRNANASAFRIFRVNSGHTVTIQGLTISGGLVQSTFPSNAGGGIYNDHSTVTVSSCVLSGNSASFGGAVFTNGLTSGAAALTLNNSTVSNNSAGNSGGGIFSDGDNSGNATLGVNNSTVSGNTAVLGGGGIYSSAEGGSATASVNNSTFSGNSATSIAGGIYSDGVAGNAALTISNSTLTGNSATSGGAIYIDGSNAGNAKLDIGNSILKTGASGTNVLNNSGTVISHGYNLCSDDSDGFVAQADQNSADPMLGPLKDNGGPTLTHAPLINSPAIDQGKRNTIAALATNLDQRAFARPVDDPLVFNPNTGDGSDIGAVELPAGLHPSNAASWKTHGDAGDFKVILPHAGLGIECRSGGADGDYKIIVNFAQPVTFTGAAVTSGIGEVSSMNITGNASHFGEVSSAGTQITINLTGVASGQTIVLALFNVDDGTKHSDVGVRMGVLVGDANDSGNVSSSDISQIKFQSGRMVDEDNFRADVVANGAINASDIGAVKINSGTALP